MKAFIIKGTVIAGILLQTACIKDKDYADGKYGLGDVAASPVGVGFPQAQNRINVISLDNISTAQTFEIALVNLLSAEPAVKDLHIKIKPAPGRVQTYNAENNPDLTLLPDNAFTMASYTAVIPKGQRTAVLSISFPDASNLLDLTKTYGLGLEIESVEEPGILIAGNQPSFLLGVAIKNKFDGIYTMKGYSLRAGDAAKTGLFDPIEMTLLTAGVHSIDFEDLQVWADGTGVGIGEPKLTVDPVTNKVTITSSGGAYNLPGYDSRYEEATKTFYIGFTWGGGPASRVAIDTLVYNRPR